MAGWSCRGLGGNRRIPHQQVSFVSGDKGGELYIHDTIVLPFKTMYNVTQRDQRRGLAAGDDTRGPAGTPG